MDHQQAKTHLYCSTFLLGGMRRRAALRWLTEQGDAAAAEILVDAIGRNHPQGKAIRHFLAGIKDSEAVRVLIREWTRTHPDWLGPIAVERSLGIGTTSELPLARETAWLVAQHKRGPLENQVNLFADRVIEAKPDFYMAFLFKLGRLTGIEQSRAAAGKALELLADEDEEVLDGAEIYLDRLPKAEQFNDLIVDEWIRTQSPFLAKLISQPRLPSNPAKEALIRLFNGDAAGYGKLQDRDGMLLAEALALATPEMRKAINETILKARDGDLADAYRLAASGRSQSADPQMALRALIASGNEDGLVEATRTMTLAEVLPLCKHWAESKRRPAKEKYRVIVDRAVAALAGMPDVEVETAPALPEGIEDLFDVWLREKCPDKQLRTDLKAEDPFARARALFLGSERGVVTDAELRAKATSADWPERLVAALRGSRPDNAGEDHVAWINTAAGLDADIMAARIACGPDELQWSEGLCGKLRSANGLIAARNLALAETLAAFRSLYGGTLSISDDDSAQKREALRVGTDDVDRDELKF